MAQAKQGEVRVPHPARGQLQLTLNHVHEVRLVPRNGGARWAEEVAAIADDLLLPEVVRGKLEGPGGGSTD